MSTITTHVLDLTRGEPATGVRVTLDRRDDRGAWSTLGHALTDADGRLSDSFGNAAAIRPGVHRLTFETGAYFEARSVRSFHPCVTIVFHISEADDHYHVPLLLSPFGYSTYRGS